MILVLTGVVHSGKTTLLKNLLPSLEALRLPVCGYLSPQVVVEGRIAGYDLLDIRKGQVIPFLRTEGEPGWQKVGPYFFLPAGLEAARAAICSRRPEETLIVDEVGPMELSGRGVWPALKEALSKPSFNCLLVVRKPLVSDLPGLVANQKIEVLDISAGDAPSALLARLSKMAASPRTRRTRRRGRSGS